jgi:hypothetical protein
MITFKSEKTYQLQIFLTTKNIKQPIYEPKE